jgi:acyl carrier protein
MVLTKIRQLLSKKFKVSEDKIKPETRLREDLNVDSLDAMDLVIALEEEFKLDKIADSDIANLKSVKDILNYLTSKGIK